jgi:hypothetical protein
MKKCLKCGKELPSFSIILKKMYCSSMCEKKSDYWSDMFDKLFSTLNPNK